MINFAIQKNLHFEENNLTIYNLIRNDKCLVDEFIDEIKKDNNLYKEIGDLYAILEFYLQNKTQILPLNKFRKLNLDKKTKYSTYELKSKHLRLYFMYDATKGNILIIGGKKKNQDQDIQRLKKIIQEYSQFKN